jgi:2-dehydropantoate 2-reductase
MEKIFIIGAGAIGRALAVFLKQEGRDVVILRGSVDNLKSYEETIEVIVSDGSILQSTIEVSTLSNYQKIDGIIVLTNKSFGNTSLANDLKNKTGDSPLVVLQNGLNVEHPFLDSFSNVYRCVLFATSQVISHTALRFKPVSPSPIGIIKGSLIELNRVVAGLDTANFRFRSEENIQQLIWKKVIANCVFNSICPLLDADNGIFHRNAETLALAKQVIDECISIAKAVGINLTTSDVIETVLLISKSSDGQLISTLQDIKNKRPTEIESLNFAVSNVARQLNLANLVPVTSMLGELTRLKSKVVQE